MSLKGVLSIFSIIGVKMNTPKQFEEQSKTTDEQIQVVLAQITELKKQIELLELKTSNEVFDESSILNFSLEQIALFTIDSLSPLAKHFSLLPLAEKLRICKSAVKIVPI